MDNYQGEENDIILLSLVRSNDKGAVGFLKIENRVCVALSRAKFGLYIAGNMEQLCASGDLWKQIKETLETNGCIGDALTLKCQNHPEQLNEVRNPDEFMQFSPRGGCKLKCDGIIPKCGHLCQEMCHTDDIDHKEVCCKQPCALSCPENHKCSEPCYKECPDCRVTVKTTLDCGHTHKFFCHIVRSGVKCPTVVEKTIPHCNHTVKMPCSQDPSKFSCPEKCTTRLDCGHACKNTCHVKDDPDHLKYMCREPCALINKNCSEKHQCKKECYEECLNCLVKVEKRAKCGHKAQVSCSNDLSTYICKLPCKRQMACGHFCKLKCHEECNDCRVGEITGKCFHSFKVR